MKIKKSEESRLPWSLFLSDTHQVVYFSTEARLKKFAHDLGYAIRPFPDRSAFYTLSVGYVPGNGDED